MPLFTVFGTALATAYVAGKFVRRVRSKLRSKIYPMGNHGWLRIKEVQRMRQFGLITPEQHYQALRYFAENSQSFRPHNLWIPPGDDNFDFSERTAAKVALGDRAHEVENVDMAKIEDEDEEEEPEEKKEQEEFSDVSGFDVDMTMDTALDILGLSHVEAKDKKLVNKRFRTLMLKNHPDIGGSAYVAYKINEAKEVVLGERPAAVAEKTPEKEQEEEEKAEKEAEKTFRESHFDMSSDEAIRRSMQNLTRGIKTNDPSIDIPIYGPKYKIHKKPVESPREKQRENLEQTLERKRKLFEEQMARMRQAKAKEFEEFVEKLKKQGIREFGENQEAPEMEEEKEEPQTKQKKSKKSKKRKSTGKRL